MITHTYTLQFYIKANRGENCTGRCRHSSMEDKTALACTIRFLFLYPSCSKWQRAHKHTHLHTRTVAFRPNNRPRIETRVWQHWRTETLQNTWSQTTYDFSLFSGSFNLLLWWKNISGRESLKNVHRKGFDGQERLNNTNVEKRNVQKKKKKTQEQKWIGWSCFHWPSLQSAPDVEVDPQWRGRLCRSCVCVCVSNKLQGVLVNVWTDVRTDGVWQVCVDPSRGPRGSKGGTGDVTMHAFSAAGERDLHTVIKPRNTERIRRSVCERVGVCARLDANR